MEGERKFDRGGVGEEFTVKAGTPLEALMSLRASVIMSERMPTMIQRGEARRKSFLDVVRFLRRTPDVDKRKSLLEGLRSTEPGVAQKVERTLNLTKAIVVMMQTAKSQG